MRNGPPKAGRFRRFKRRRHTERQTPPHPSRLRRATFPLLGEGFFRILIIGKKFKAVKMH